jgi:hypothetical protein
VILLAFKVSGHLKAWLVKRKDVSSKLKREKEKPYAMNCSSKIRRKWNTAPVYNVSLTIRASSDRCSLNPLSH